MKLVQFENYKLVISEEALFVKSFREIWERDQTPEKEIALLEFGFLYFQLDPRSDYMFIEDEVERFEEIKLREGLKSDWQPDELVQAAIIDYKFLTQTTSSLLLEDTRLAIGKIRKFLRDVDLTEEDDKGKAKYTIQSITSATSQLPKLAKDLAEAQKEIDKEISENSKMRGKKTKKVMEDGLRRNKQ